METINPTAHIANAIHANANETLSSPFILGRLNNLLKIKFKVNKQPEPKTQII